MIPAIIYIIKTAFYLASFYLVYILFLSRDTTHIRNRLFIIVSLIAAVTFPLLSLTYHIKIVNIQFFGKLLSEVIITPAGNTIQKTTHSSNLTQIIFTIYVIVAMIFLIKVIFDLANLLLLILRHRKKGSRIIRYNGPSASGFSAMGYIFINSGLSTEDENEIIKHEHNHINQNHFLDIILIEIVKSFQWFNPAVYMFNKSLRAIHEYQADERCLMSGVSITKYQSLLLSQVFKTRAFNLTNSFANPSLLKKRMVMMTKKRSSALAKAKIFFVIPVIGLVFMVISASKSYQNVSVDRNVSENKTVIDESNINPFVTVDQMPAFPGGEAALLKYIAKNTHYPEKSVIKGDMGKVIVKFCVNTDGRPVLVRVLQGVSSELDKEAVRVVKELPEFNPGKNKGKAVPVWYMVPINFTLK